MEKLRELVIKLATAQKKHPLSSSQITLIDQRLHREFPLGLRTPNHPTYAFMINKAITELDEEGGSNETSISEYIKEHFEDLAWGHKSFLNHHLNKLCDEGLIVLNASGRYSISAVNEEQESSKLVIEASARDKPTSLEENELVEVEVHGSGDEQLTSLCETGVITVCYGADSMVGPIKTGPLEIKRYTTRRRKSKGMPF